MSDSILMHDATDRTQTLQILEAEDSATWRRPPDASGDLARIDASAGAAKLANLDSFSRIDQALRTTGYSPLLNLHILVAEGIVVLRGAVPSYYMKQIAQEVVSGVRGITQVHNLLDVMPRERQ
jgi:hypothetical protein